MATYVAYTPTTVIAKAMFNFDAFGLSNFKLDGTVRISVSDSFSRADYLDPAYTFYEGLYTSASSEVVWTTQMTGNLQEIAELYSQFADIAFAWTGDYDATPPGPDATPNPEDVGRAGLSDINVNWIYRSDGTFAGISGIDSDSMLGYAGAAGDIYLNQYALKFAGDYSLDLNTRARQTLMHEIGHSLGLAHPHSAYSNGVATITADYSATTQLGFDQLGFHVDSAADMYREYFTIMSYDDQQSLLPGSTVLFHAHTPMILDVIALQQAYGEGAGTTGFGDDTIVAGTAGYRTYFDRGGIDTIDLSIYGGGAYLQMGVEITGAAHRVGIAMSADDAFSTIVLGDNPAHLRWFYGDYENAIGASGNDFIIGNPLENVIRSETGDDFVDGRGGHDRLEGGEGYDVLAGGEGNDVLLGGNADDELSGDEEVDMILGGEGADTLDGGAQADELYGEEGNDGLYGGSGFVTDILVGGAGDDVLDGSALPASGEPRNAGDYDLMDGGAGNDIYHVDTPDDLTFEIADGGTDTVVADIVGAGYQLYANVENLTLQGKTPYGVGNELDNVLTTTAEASVLLGGGGNDTLDGGAEPDLLFGENGNDLLYGGTGFFTDILVGGAGEDVLDGSASSVSGQRRNEGDYDLMYGGTENDTYQVDTPFDLTFETEIDGGGGTDTVIADITGAGYYLYAAVENLVLQGNTPFGVGNDLDNVLTGSALSNWLLGGAGNDTLNGKAGGDVLFGETGADTFVFERGTGGDVIGDFTPGTDKLQLAGIGYTNLTEVKAHMVEAGGVSAIDLGAGDFVVLHNVTIAGLSEGDFIFG